MNYLILILVILFNLNVSSESFDEKIKKFLLNNPEIILESLENYEKKQISEKKKIDEARKNEETQKKQRRKKVTTAKKLAKKKKQ